MRTLGQGDLQVLQGRVPRVGRSEHVWAWWTLAHSVWMVDGRVVSPKDTERLADTFREMDLPLFQGLFDLFVHNLVGRQERAKQASYVFVYERASRDFWRVSGARPWERNQIEASRQAGDNPVLKWWVTFNQLEDMREQFLPHWRAYKLITSATSPKGVKKINDADDRQEQEERERREAALHRYFWYRAGRLTEEGYRVGWGKGQLGIKPFAGAKSVEELEREYRQWVRGEEDDHDRIVREYKETTLREIEERKRSFYTAQTPTTQEGEQFLEQGPDLLHPMRVEDLGPVRRKTSTWIPDLNATLYQGPKGRPV